MSSLLEPLVLRPGVVARNRAWVAPLTNMQSHPDGTCSEHEERFLGMRADGGFGLEQVRERLATLHGGAARLVVEPAGDGEGGTVARIELPLPEVNAP